MCCVEQRAAEEKARQVELELRQKQEAMEKERKSLEEMNKAILERYASVVCGLPPWASAKPVLSLHGLRPASRFPLPLLASWLLYQCPRLHVRCAPNVFVQLVCVHFVSVVRSSCYKVARNWTRRPNNALSSNEQKKS